MVSQQLTREWRMPTQQTQFLSELKSVNTVNLAKLNFCQCRKNGNTVARKRKVFNMHHQNVKTATAQQFNFQVYTGQQL